MQSQARYEGMQSPLACLPEALLVLDLRLCKLASVAELQGLIVEIDAPREIRIHRSLAEVASLEELVA